MTMCSKNLRKFRIVIKFDIFAEDLEDAIKIFKSVYSEKVKEKIDNVDYDVLVTM